MLGKGSIWLADLVPGSGSRSARKVKEELQQVKDWSKTQDSELIRQTRAGNHRAFEMIVRRYQKLVYNVVYQMVRAHESASDLTQETFLKAYRALATFQLDRSFKPWLLRIATNTAINSLRDSRKLTSLDELLEQNPQAEPVSSEDLETEVEWRVTQHMLFEALGAIPLRQREMFVLRYQHDLSYEEISEITGVTVSSVKSLLFRARDALRKLLKEQMEFTSSL